MTSAEPKPLRTRHTPRKLGQPSKLSAKAREALARTAAALAGRHAERHITEAPRATPVHAVGAEVRLHDDARRALRMRARLMIVVACDCVLCRDGRWVAVDAPMKHDPTQQQHFACSKLKRPGKSKEKPSEEDQDQ